MTETQLAAIEDYMHAVSECGGISQSAGAGTVARLAKAESTLLAALADTAQEPTCTGWVAPKNHYAVPVFFNPYTGEPRDVRDVQSDPQGVMIIPPGKVEVLAAQPPAPVQKSVAWKHDCAALLTTVVPWIDACPHCGKPRTPPADVTLLTDGEIIAAIASAKKVPTTYAGWVRDQRIEYGRAIEQAVRQKAGLA